MDAATTTLKQPPSPPEERSCTRCDGTQHLVAVAEGMGKYRCDDCAMAVGFDLQSDRREFLIDRGIPARYTQDMFGPVLLSSERRI
jgi:hypothetical protein